VGEPTTAAAAHPGRTRLAADERREQILDAAVTEFAHNGLKGATTEAIAARAGITQPYVYRFFRSKKELFVASVERCFDRCGATFVAAAAGGDTPPAKLKAMGNAYVAMLVDLENLLAQLQAYAACGDPAVQQVVRRRFSELYELVERTSGAGREEVRAFFANGMLINVAAALDLMELARPGA
jgi:AcrR family transcriptional regulator